MVEEKPTNAEVEEPTNPEAGGLNNESAESSPPQNEELVDLVKKICPDADVSDLGSVSEPVLEALRRSAPIYDKIYDVAVGAPESAAFVNDLLETGDVAKSLARNYDPDELVALWEEVTDDSNEEDRNAHVEKVTKAKERVDMVKNNMDVSMGAISDFMEERKHWPPAKSEEFEQKVVQFYQDGADGLVTPEALAILEKGFYHDDDVTEAEENGKIMGKNETIVAKKLDKAKEKELLPTFDGGAAKIVSADENPEDKLTANLRKRAEQKPILG